MTRMECVLFFVVACVAGCASPSQSDPQFVANEQHIHQVVAHEVNHVPDLIQTNAEIEGEHPLGYYVQIALGQNPEILAAHRAINASAAVIPQVIALDDPMLVDTLQPFDKHSVQTAAGRAPNTLTLSQKFPWFGKLDARGQVAEHRQNLPLGRDPAAERADFPAAAKLQIQGIVRPVCSWIGAGAGDQDQSAADEDDVDVAKPALRDVLLLIVAERAAVERLLVAEIGDRRHEAPDARSALDAAGVAARVAAVGDMGRGKVVCGPAFKAAGEIGDRHG